MSLNTLQIKARLSRAKKYNAVGALGEQLAASLLKESGYKVTPNRIGERLGDLTAIEPNTGQVFRVEVKTARRTTDNKWRFRLTSRGKPQLENVDFVILITVTRTGEINYFTVPKHELANNRMAVISSHPRTYSGRLAPYRQTGPIRLESIQ